VPLGWKQVMVRVRKTQGWRPKKCINALILRAGQGCGCQAVLWNVGSAGVPE